MNTPSYCTPLASRKSQSRTRVPLSPLPPDFSPVVCTKPRDFEKENTYLATPPTASSFESPFSDMDSPYFTLR
ncbi:unnamed protein product [Blepharisma stoltei]|uniref:Uncharacterized protein n=1 Tax=Blepharisma stoltei TaxID=1481888 RepID=A0AAU9J1C5_9CILI|nr:unnamed protein product [Blepharisma stoltei]